MAENPTTEAMAAIRRVRGRAIRRRIATAFLRAVAVGALTATAIAGATAAIGRPPGAWMLLALAPAAVVLALGLRNSPVSLRASALLLDESARTQERFSAALACDDPEVRDLVSRQALVAGAPAAVRFPPSAEGLAAALGLAALGAVLLLAPGGGEIEGEARGAARGGGGSVTPASGAPEADADSLVARVEAGEMLTEREWRELARRGVLTPEAETAREASSAGDLAVAARILREALERVRAEAADVPAAWTSYGENLARPGWSPRFDRCVREYFTLTAERGLR